jgi:pheromone shutdown protein TraB
VISKTGGFMEAYLMGWFHAVFAIIIVVMVVGLVISLIKIHKLEINVKDLQSLIDDVQINQNNNLKELEVNLTNQITDVERSLESSIDSRVNKLENKIKIEK